jgi:hypothetical protein
MKVLNWDTKFDAAYGIVHMPANEYVFFRGYNIKFPLSERPAYFGTELVASIYSKESEHTLSAFTNKKDLRLVDIRFMKNILRDIFERNADKYFLNDGMKCVTLSFGLCSLIHQSWMASNRFSNALSTITNKHKMVTMGDMVNALKSYIKQTAYEQPGVRIAETKNDSYTMGFLKGLFEGQIDGFIAPQTYSPFHIERTNNVMPAELIIFNPIQSGIQKFNYFPPIDAIETMQEFYSQQNLTLYTDNNYDDIDYTFFLQNGGDNEVCLSSVEELHIQYNSNKEIKHNYEEGVRTGKLLNNCISLYKYEPPIPTVNVSPWISGNSSKKHTITTDYGPPHPCVPVSPWPKKYVPFKKTRKNKLSDFERFMRF